jgi:hypothetical protein
MSLEVQTANPAANMLAEKILLQSGPWHDRYIDDIETVEIKMAIKNPSNGQTGIAIYLPETTRDVAHWDRNEWDELEPA